MDGCHTPEVLSVLPLCHLVEAAELLEETGQVVVVFGQRPAVADRSRSARLTGAELPQVVVGEFAALPWRSRPLVGRTRTWSSPLRASTQA